MNEMGDARATNLVARINDDFMANGPVQRRAYLGMSRIGECARVQYVEFVDGPAPNLTRTRYGYRGYLFEADAKKRLTRIGLYVPGSERHVVAPFDQRFQGHTDGMTGDGFLLELKSINPKGFFIVAAENQPKREHLSQVQTYLRYADLPAAWIVYINCDTMDHYPLFVERDEEAGVAMEERAKTILAAIDARQPPVCECGWCGQKAEVIRLDGAGADA